MHSSRSVNWLRQGFNILLSLQKERPAISHDTLMEVCLRNLLLFTEADEVCWIEKESLFSSCISSTNQAITDKLKYTYDVQRLLLEQNEAGPVSCDLSRRLAGISSLQVLIPVRCSKTIGCYVLDYGDELDINDEFAEFLQVCKLAVTDLHNFFDLNISYEKLKIRFNGILKSLPHGIVFLEDEGDYCWVNKNAAQLLGIPSGTIKPLQIHTAMASLRNKANYIHHSDGANLEDHHDKQWKWLFQQPELMVLDVTLRPVSTSMIRGNLWVWEDVTKSYTYDQKLLQLNDELVLKKEQAEEISQRYSYVGQATFDAIWDWDLVNDALFWGKNYEIIFGYNSDLLVANIDDWKQRIHPEDVDRVLSTHDEVIFNGKKSHWEEEYRYKRADGSFVYVADKAFVIRNDCGKALRVVGAMQDITSKKLAEIKIGEAEFNLRAIFESSIESFLLLDSCGHVKVFNSRAKDYIQMVWGKNLKLGDNILDYLDGISGEKFKDHLAQVAEGDVVEFDWRFERPCASVYWSHFTLAPVYHEQAVIGTSITERDITEVKKHLKIIENQNQTFSDISWTQSHLVRAPLANIMGIAALLKSSCLPDEIDELVESLEISANKLDAVINRITNMTSGGNLK